MKFKDILKEGKEQKLFWDILDSQSQKDSHGGNIDSAKEELKDRLFDYILANDIKIVKKNWNKMIGKMGIRWD